MPCVHGKGAVRNVQVLRAGRMHDEERMTVTNPGEVRKNNRRGVRFNTMFLQSMYDEAN